MLALPWSQLAPRGYYTQALTARAVYATALLFSNYSIGGECRWEAKGMSHYHVRIVSRVFIACYATIEYH